VAKSKLTCKIGKISGMQTELFHCALRRNLERSCSPGGIKVRAGAATITDDFPC